jgi:hypothetical protein
MKENWAHSKGTQDWREAYKELKRGSMLNKEEGRREKGDGRWKMEDGSDWFQQRSGRSSLVPLFLRGESFR